MNCNYYRGKCLFLNGKENDCNDCPIKKAYNKGVRDTKNKKKGGDFMKDERYLTFKEIAHIFEERYHSQIKDYRPICDLFLEDKRGLTIWLDNGDMIIYCPKEIN